MDGHVENLKSVCYHCGLRSRRQLTPPVNKRHFKKVEDCDPNKQPVNGLTPKPEREVFCYRCQTDYFKPLSKASRKTAVDKLIREIEVSFYTFKPHSQNGCEIVKRKSSQSPVQLKTQNPNS